MKHVLPIIVSTVFGCLLLSSYAQDMGGVVGFNNIQRNITQNAEENRATLPSVLMARSETTTSSDTRFSFEPDPALRNQAMRAFLSDLRQSRPAIAKQLDNVDLFEVLAGEANAANLSVNNLEDGLAFLAVRLWEITNQQPYNQSAQTADDRRKLAAIKPAILEMINQNEAENFKDKTALQNTSDYVWLMSMFFFIESEIAYNGDGSGISSLTQNASKLGMELFGIDLRDVDLTRRGFVPRNKEAFEAKYGD